MGYLNNSTIVLAAILTKTGREILSSGGDFEVTKFALGDDEIDYVLWDTSHTSGTDYYGAAIDNLPALEPFNDPSEIMKYKLVTRTWPGTEAMAKLTDQAAAGGTASGLTGLKWYTGTDGTRTGVEPLRPETDVNGDIYTGKWPAGKLGHIHGSTGFNVGHLANFDHGNIDYPVFAGEAGGETFTVTLLDSSVACLAPESIGTSNPRILAEGTPTAGMTGTDFLWMPFIDNVQHLSQTFAGCVKAGNKFVIANDGTERELKLYSKKVAATATSSIIISGDLSGAVIEFPVTITYVDGSP